jgi:hypothetical protein
MSSKSGIMGISGINQPKQSVNDYGFLKVWNNGDVCKKMSQNS